MDNDVIKIKINPLGFNEEARLRKVARVVILNSSLVQNYYVLGYLYRSEISAAKMSTNNKGIWNIQTTAYAVNIDVGFVV